MLPQDPASACSVSSLSGSDLLVVLADGELTLDEGLFGRWKLGGTCSFGGVPELFPRFLRRYCHVPSGTGALRMGSAKHYRN